MSISVRESSGVVKIDRVDSHEVATRICSRFQAYGIPARVSTLPGTTDYQVIVPNLGIAAVERILKELKIEPVSSAPRRPGSAPPAF